ncbi:hypothetical protein [Pontibacter kalidii]|uniref:hypothetical protein n=1 Tax=Pontibacter kalidii TaxID=2592049 RepID=UPI00224CECDF|nr:hypothetical protein [Pontibacter kalidii]
MIDYAKNINQAAALAAWWKIADKYNKSLPLHPVVRTYANGTQKTVFIRKGIISKSVIETGEKLILQYIKSFNEARKLELVQDEAPSLATNSVELGRILQTSDRTVRSHISVLKRPGVGFISEYNFRGTRANFELWINPAILWPGQTENSKNTAQTAQILPQNKNLPHIKQLETPETKEKEITHVDKGGVATQQSALPGGEGEAGYTGDTFTSDTGLLQTLKTTEKAPARPLAAKRQATEAGSAARTEKDAQMAVFKAYVENFWAIASKLLYPTADWTEWHHKMAKNAIFYGVYRGFKAQLSEKDWELYHLQAIERLKLAANYYENHPGKHPPLPYAEFRPGTGYFDHENTRGFEGTHEWYTKQQVWKRQQKVNDALRRAANEIRLHKQGKLREELQRKTPLEMFRFQEARIKRLGKAALDKFYAQHAITKS